MAGCNRSGKTTLANLFANHPSVSVVPNASNLSQALPNSVTERCPHVWSEKLDRFRLNGADDQRPAARLARDWLQYAWRPRPVIVVESDLPAVQMPWLQEVFPEAYFVGVVRNGYAVAEGLRTKEGYSIDRCARQWNLVNKVMLEDAKSVGNFRLVRYEELVARPEEVATSLAHFLDLDAAPLRPFLSHGWRLGNLDTHPSKLRDANPELMGRLSPQDIEIITANAWEMLDRLGYLAPERTDTRGRRA